jgi:acetate kinase
MSRTLGGKIDRIGKSDCALTYKDGNGHSQVSVPVKAADLAAAGSFLAGWLEKRPDFVHVQAIGHRIVHGLDHSLPALIDDSLLNELHGISSYDPDHLPGEIALIEFFRKRHPRLPQVASFDTAFHAGLPRIARLLPIPRRFDRAGIRRYGFHGLSYTSLLEQLMGVADPEKVRGRIVLAHLGNGCSITAIRNLQPIDTSMGFTPAGGLPMGTRSGDLDPGVAWWLMQREGLSPTQFNDLINHQSGLLGVSETSSDMEDLLTKESADERAAEAVALFCYQVKKYIGAYTAVLGGLELLAFTGGIGENAAPIRSRICTGLGYLGIEPDEERNQRDGLLISADSSRIPVYVIPADEESMIAKNTASLLPFIQK